MLRANPAASAAVEVSEVCELDAAALDGRLGAGVEQRVQLQVPAVAPVVEVAAREAGAGGRVQGHLGDAGVDSSDARLENSRVDPAGTGEADESVGKMQSGAAG